MLNGPLGSSEFNNEFGRPTVAGYFRVFEETIMVKRGVLENPLC